MRKLLVVSFGALVIGAVSCDEAPRDGGSRTADCAALRRAVETGRSRLRAVSDAAPSAEAPLDEVATHDEEMARAAGEIRAAVEALKVQSPDVRDAVVGLSMLAKLTAERLGSAGKTMRELGEAAKRLGVDEDAANDAAEGIEPKLLAGVGCEGSKAAPCVALAEALVALDRSARSGMTPEDAARAVRERARRLDDVAAALEAAPAPGAKREARDAAAKRARQAAGAFRKLADALDAVGPARKRLDDDQPAGQVALSRLATELDAADTLCGGKPAASASAPGSAVAPPGSAAPGGPPGSAAPGAR